MPSRETGKDKHAPATAFPLHIQVTTLATLNFNPSVTFASLNSFALTFGRGDIIDSISIATPRSSFATVMMVHTLASSRSQEESQEAVPAVARMSKAILTGTLSDSEAYEVLGEKADYYASEDYDNPALGTSIQTVFREALAPKTLAARNGQVAKLLKQTLMKVGKLYEQDEMKKDNETGGMGASPLLRAPMSAISSTDGSLMENQRADARFYSDTITEGEVDVIDRPSEDLEEQIQWEYEQAQEAKKPTEVAEKKASRGRPKKGTREPSRGSERVKQLEERNSSLKGNTNTVEEETMVSVLPIL